MKRIILFACWSMIVSGTAQAQVNSTTPGWFAFNVSAFDVAPSPIDLSYSNEKPAGKNGFLRAQNGVIVDGTGKPVKLFGAFDLQLLVRRKPTILAVGYLFRSVYGTPSPDQSPPS